MDRLIVARHAESEYNAKGFISADPSSPRSPLTQRGRQQAQQLAEQLAAEQIDLSVTSGTLRAVWTSEIVATALSIPVVETSLLGDPPAGIFEDGPVEAFVEWMNGCDPDAFVPGTSTSLRDSAQRYFDAVTMLLTRPERTVLQSAPSLSSRMHRPFDGSRRPPKVEPTRWTTATHCLNTPTPLKWTFSRFRVD